MPWLVALFVGVLVSGIIGCYVAQCRRGRQRVRQRKLAQARRDFRFQRERLEAKFIQLARERIDPANWLWDDAQFDDDVAFAVHRYTGELSAYIAVTVERIRPDLLQTLAGKCRSVRSATIVFQFDGRRWETEGRAILNLSPEETVHLYKRELQRVEQDAPAWDDDARAIG